MLHRFKGVRSVLTAALIAVLLSVMMMSRAEACACCETYGVIDVAANDELNIRENADPNARRIGAIPSGQCGIERTGPEARGPYGAWWVEIVYGDITGWVNKRYIEWIHPSGRNSSGQNQQSGGSKDQPYWCGRSDLNDAEAAVCDTQSLWSLDSAISTAYSRARSDSPRDAGYIGDKQKSWLRFRNSCRYDVACLRQRYDDQISWLEGYFNN